MKMDRRNGAEKKPAAVWVHAVVLTMAAPLIGVALAGYPLKRYAHFPPTTHYVRHQDFSWPVFIGYAVFITMFVLPLLLRFLRIPSPRRRPPATPFPWWGWLSMSVMAAAWILAWTRFTWFEAFQAHTFGPLWLSFVFVLNALCYRRSGRCLLTHRTGFLMVLFPVSAAFWWVFEYLNRFVQNWYYVGVVFAPGEYVLYASLSFSMVLPAVYSMQQLIGAYDGIRPAFSNWHPVGFKQPRRWAWMTLAAISILMALMGVAPNHLFALLWLGPLLIFVSVLTLQGKTHVLSGAASGDWTRIVSFALAALACGFFWEMWNYYSMANWKYSIPYVHRFMIFEMPLLGYAGYLPFGLACAVVGQAVLNILGQKCADE